MSTLCGIFLFINANKILQITENKKFEFIPKSLIAEFCTGLNTVCDVEMSSETLEDM